MIIKQISIFVENRKGRLYEITELLAKNNVNLRAFTIADTTNFGILRIIVENPAEVEALLKDNGITVSTTEVLSVSIKDRPGGLAEVLKILADADISVEYTYAFLSHIPNEASVNIRVDDVYRAKDVLKQNGFNGNCIQEHSSEQKL